MTIREIIHRFGVKFTFERHECEHCNKLTPAFVDELNKIWCLNCTKETKGLKVAGRY